MSVTRVVFRYWRVSNDVIALFPGDRADMQGNCMSYEHVGQHGAADYGGIIQQSRPATSAEYAALKIELEGMGYVLKVCKRASCRTG